MTKHTIRLGDWATLGQDATAIRFEVFVDEQKVPAEIELDDMDAVCLHAVAYDDAGNAIGTGRLLPDGHIGRMAVRQPGRGTGVGGAILTLLMDKARERGDAAVVLNAQTVAAPFYARHGFVQQGEQFEEAGIAHVEMRLQF
ncbi:GNAT family N-acetyltransferase [Janthinobacterium sp. FW305-129]|uniref:GNAT family N-acetyltransferase n=1 Tax=Janthinobacterium sp. FW305-129 TaxID=2775054 RepID=UPI001E2E7448|nr:GNAT family N-acetyltransferase [Janthinobacterium sp. FW305-129]MCC7596030.1 GNAT family N-acetyltransferase [Janthinobacterium sp. FW305-129]